MGTPYEMNRPAVVNETIALNATVEPMLMMHMIPVKTVQNAIEFRGNRVRVLTWKSVSKV